GVTLDNQDIDLTIALDTSIDISLPDAPIRPESDTRDVGFLPTITRVVPSLDFGGEGFFSYTQGVAGRRNLVLETMPDVPGALLTFQAGAYTTDGTSGNELISGTATMVQGSPNVSGSGGFLTDNNGDGEPDIIGNIFVTIDPTATDGTRFAAVVFGVTDDDDLQLADPAPFSTSGAQAFHVGRAGVPSSEVQQDGVGPDLSGGITIQPVLGLSEILNPLEGGVLENRTMRWKLPQGQPPSVHDMYLYEPFALATFWEVYADGLRTKVVLPKTPPDLESIAQALPTPEAACMRDPTVSPLCAIFGFDPTGKTPYVLPGDTMARGAIRWQDTASFTPGLDYNDFGYLQITDRGRRSWTTDQHDFIHGDDP
ncbi:MAG TPA: hypothetical protein VGO62_19195, partial [Myxococcota bacterium]